MSSSYHRDKEEDTEKIMKNVLEDWMKRGVLVAISIPIFTAQLEKSREATDAANVRAAYAEAAAKQIDGTISSTATVVTIKATDTTYAAIGNPKIGNTTMKDLGFTSGNSYKISVSESGVVTKSDA